MGLKFSRKTYRGRPTRWQLVTRFYHYKREAWPALKSIAIRMFLEGRLSVAEYLEHQNLEVTKSWRWIEAELEARKGKPPSRSLDQIDIYRLGEAVHNIETDFKRIAEYLMVLETCPIEECPGYVFNQKFNVSREEREEVVRNPFGYLDEDL